MTLIKKQEKMELILMPSRFEAFDERDADSWSARLKERLKHAFRPVVPGLFLDLVDFITFGPIGLYSGIIVGCPLGYYICARARLSFSKRLLGAGLAGLYCTLPFTGWLPAAALLGFYTRFWENPSSLNKS